MKILIKNEKWLKTHKVSIAINKHQNEWVALLGNIVSDHSRNV